ncbi:hypothetical protein DOY81_006630 [Sarcophaga bullata]|nr:hypothetical protein DOY81_006630 [Sarcophaga bullata]
MAKFLYTVIYGALLLGCLEFSNAKEISLSSKDFQKEFLEKIANIMQSSAEVYLNDFLKNIKKPASVQENFQQELQAALNSQSLEPKIVFIKQYLDMEEHKYSSRENIYGLRNVIFLQKLKDNFYELQEYSLEDIHQQRYFYLCKQFKVQQKQHPATANNNSNTRPSLLTPLSEEHMVSMMNRLGVKPNETISLNVKQFGQDLYEKVKTVGADVINDYLIIISKLLKEVLQPQTGEETDVTPHSEALKKIAIEIDTLLNITDFYSKRQRLYDYLQNHLALDYELLENSATAQHDLMEIFEKLKQKGLNLVVAFLFSNFEFIDHLHDIWKQQLPATAELLLYDAQSRPLKRIQQLYDDFKQDFENSLKYDTYLEEVKQLHNLTQQENADPTHIYEMLYSAAQNVGSSRATLMNSKCNEIIN